MSETPNDPARFAPTRGARVLFMLLPTLVVLLALGGAGEIAVRYHERHRSTVPGTMPSLYYRQGLLGHALVRDYDYYGWVHTNAQGFRGVRPVPMDKSPGTFRILAVGGSTTFDSEVSADSAAWPARLERVLNALLPGRQIEVVNAGVPGYGMDQDLIRLEMELYAYHPDLLILYQGHNDLFYGLKIAAGVNAVGDEQRPGEVASVTPWMHWLERHSLLYSKLRERFLVLQFARLGRRSNRGPKARASSLIEPGAQRFARDVRTYFAVARTLGIPVVVPEVVQVSGNAPHETDPWRLMEWRGTVPFVPTDTVLAGYVRYNAILKSLCDSSGVPFIPMRDLGIAGVDSYSFGDPIHFNDRGADRFATGLGARLVQRHLILSSGAAQELSLAASGPAGTRGR